jgi:hypothetical protein
VIFISGVLSKYCATILKGLLNVFETWLNTSFLGKNTCLKLFNELFKFCLSELNWVDISEINCLKFLNFPTTSQTPSHNWLKSGK